MIKVNLEYSSDLKFNKKMEFKDEKEMLEWGLKQHDEIIISHVYEGEFNESYDYTMEIYDDYRE